MSAPIAEQLRFRVVAAGIGKRGGLRATLIATPTEQITPETLKDWPKAVGDYVHTLTPAAVGSRTAPQGAADFKAHLLATSTPAVLDEIAKLWATSFIKAGVYRKLKDTLAAPYPPESPWSVLRDDIKRNVSGRKQRPVGDSLNETYLPQPSNFDVNPSGALNARDYDPATHTLVINSLVANTQTDYAVETEALRAQRLARKLIIGPYLPGDPADWEVIRAKFKPPPQAPQDGPRPQSDSASRRLDAYVERMKAVILATDPARAIAKAAFDNGKNASVASRAAAPPPGVIAQSGRVDGNIAPDAPPPRAAHVHAAWPQHAQRRRPEQLRADAETGVDAYETLADVQARILSIFYTLQGDPMLSRLFGFAYDLEFEELPQGDDFPLWLATDTGAKVWTHAHFFRNAAHGIAPRFWPAPRDYGRAGDNVFGGEQRHGLYDLGPDYAITTVDVRHAVSNAIDSVDRGERHETLGLTLLDGERATRAARDLGAAAKLTADNDSSSGLLVLNAEDLTIGRRLDVVAVSQTRSHEWRSLMNRLVTYPKAPAFARERLREIANALGPEQHGDLVVAEESSFQLLSRALPVVGASQASDPTFNVETVVEEAIQTWTGGPMAALACRSSASTPTTPPIMPVARAYGLPDKAAGAGVDVRMPPLRYGTGYGFAMRAVYAGGRGPTVDEARALYAPPTGDSSAAQHVRTLAPRRFRRHEGVAPPILLLPSSLVPARLIDGKPDPMGFEAPGDAVLRSRIASDAPPKDPQAGEPPGSAYIPASARAHSDESYRVLVAPAAGLDFCGRHGVFDVPNPDQRDKRLSGGLTDLEFVAEPTEEPGLFNTGFPIAVVRRRSGFDGDALIYERETSKALTLDPADRLGANVFKWLPKARDKGPPGQGYLPDPAIDTLSLRLRRVGSDKYLADDVSVPLYETDAAQDYPFALPVVLHIAKASPRPRPAQAASEAMSCDKKIYRYDGEKPPSERAGARGTKVRVVEIRLAPGEQYELEAACLPSEATLAKTFAVVETMGAQFRRANSHPEDLPLLKASLIDAGGRSGPFDAIMAAASAQADSRFSGLAGSPTPKDTQLQTIAGIILDCQRKNWPLTEIAGVARLRLVHAINAPVAAPAAIALKIVRPDDHNMSDDAAPLSDTAGAKNVVLTGEIEVDLDQIDRIEVRVATVEPGGDKIDNVARGRSPLAKRSGRWPEVPDGAGVLKPMRKRAVFGFDVDPNGRPFLLSQTVTLLSIKHLPDSDAAAYAIAQTNNPPARKAFPSQNGRLTRLDLGVLHRMALKSEPLILGVPTDGQPTPEQNEVRKREVALARPRDISDTRARKLAVEIVGYSRFAGAFDTAPMFDADGREFVLHRRQPLRAYEQSLTAKLPPLAPPHDCRATERPAPPSPRTPEIFFDVDQSRKRMGEGADFTYERRCGVRLRFDRGWFSSGEGERLGIVLWPPDYMTQTIQMWESDIVKLNGRKMTLTDLRDEDLGDGGGFVTRWGGDPIRKDAEPQTAWLMPPQAFAGLDCNQVDEYFGPGADPAAPRPHDPAYVKVAAMPIGDMKPDEAAPSGAPAESEAAIKAWLDVSLLTFEPYFDIEAEEWFVDVPMNVSRATDPFIRFGLVRYQENEILDNLRVSTPVRVWTQLPPYRKAVVKVRKGTQEARRHDLDVTVTVSGVASDGAAGPPQVDSANAEAYRTLVNRMQHPRIRLTIVAELVENEETRRRSELYVVGNDVDHSPPAVNGVFEWTLTASIAQALLPTDGKSRLVAIVEEFDERLPATFASEPASVGDAYTENSLIESGPRFLARVPFWGAI